MSGFITLHREAVDHHLFCDDAQRFGAWVWLIARACWRPTKFSVGGTTIMLERGQLCASRAQLAKAWGMSPSAAERFMVRLQAEEMIERDTGQGRSIITICNYSKYQDVSGDTGQGDGDEHHPNATRSKTGQATGQALDSANNGNIEKKRGSKAEAGQATEQAADSHRTTKEPINHGTIDSVSSDEDTARPAASPPPPFDPKKLVFDGALPILLAAGRNEASARSIIGKWCKSYSPGAIIDAIARCRERPPIEPVSWISQHLAHAHGAKINDRNRPDQRHPDEPTNPFVRATLERQAERAAGVGRQSGSWPEDG